MSSVSDTMLQRLDAVTARLAALVAVDPPDDALTAPDASSGERWDRGQVWAHLAEFVPYWIEQAQLIMASTDGEAVAFGRTKQDEGRVAAIERDRSQPVSVLWSDTHADIEQLRRFLLTLRDDDWRARGLHPTLGVMPMERIVDEFLVGHLEQHADQLDELQRG